MKDGDGYIFLIMLLLGAILGIFIGVGITCCYTIRFALPDKEAICKTCPEEERVRCIVDDWDSKYIAGRGDVVGDDRWRKTNPC